MLFDTIAAISTAVQDGAISIVRLSGMQAVEIVDSICSCALKNKKTHTISYGFIIDPVTHSEVDEVLITVFKAKKTYTREDIVEINCHGGSFVTKRILQLCLMQGARLAQPGEFTRRAFLNGRIDLTQAEAIQDIIDATNDESSKLALQGLKGSVKQLLEPLIKDILDIIANIEVNIDYPEYDDVEQLSNDKIMPMLKKWQVNIENIIQRSQSGKIMREGIKTVIVGKPNVGKSSLLNALLEEEKAIVTDIAGTTRDIVEGYIHLHGLTLHLIDTAGIHETLDIVEKIGIQKSMQAIEKAQLVILVLEAGQPLDEQDEALLALTKNMTRIIVYNKTDRYPIESGIAISAAKGDIEPLIDKIHELFDKHKIAIQEPTLVNDRQISLMQQAKRNVLQAMQAISDGIALDMVELDIQNAYTNLKEILGQVHRDDLLDTLFANFCLGK